MALLQGVCHSRCALPCLTGQEELLGVANAAQQELALRVLQFLCLHAQLGAQQLLLLGKLRALGGGGSLCLHLQGPQVVIGLLQQPKGRGADGRALALWRFAHLLQVLAGLCSEVPALDKRFSEHEAAEGGE
eukprot:CAMPEP_0195103826 /NCGR_PEP_ID=MMETSP0448-20130528/72740_1 /TAXON_ID=66468 /ORGANISM="Heterocapsa triquestra, Strain CCMP 448" /LENGTH=131 /DNA_ID=CAMNT_0040139575 /DNA_START=405 /DNA_END=800 /DNA_ORIENTATION=-